MTSEKDEKEEDEDIHVDSNVDSIHVDSNLDEEGNREDSSNFEDSSLQNSFEKGELEGEQLPQLSTLVADLVADLLLDADVDV